MPLEQGSSKEIIGRNIAELIKSGHKKDQAVAIAFKEAGQAYDGSYDTMDEGEGSSRQVDNNGFVTVPDNPISRSGVFKYLGKNLPGAIPDKMYNVLRPAEELSDPEAIASFKMLPIIDDHTMLGQSAKGLTPAENKGVHGTTGQDVYFRDNVLFGNLKIFSQSLYDMVQQGKNNLSLGYRCIFEKASGVFNGEPYEYIQRRLRGNHLALVRDARCDVAILDSNDESFAFDHIDLTPHKGEDVMTEEEKKKMEAEDKRVRDVKDAEEKEKMEKEASDKKARDAKDAEEKEEKEKKDAADKAAKDAAEKDKDKDAMDSKEQIKNLTAKVADLESNGFKAIMQQATQRDQLAKDLSNHIGVFDAREMSLAETAKYGADKLGIKCTAGQEQAALAGFFAAAGNTKSVSFAMDSKAKAPIIDKLFASNK